MSTPPTPEQVKRYDVSVTHCVNAGRNHRLCDAVQESHDGRFVTYEDYTATIARLEGERDAQQQRAEAAERRGEAFRAQLIRVVGEHHAPNDCYATGPSTGDSFRDLVSCPSCEALGLLREHTAARAAAPRTGEDTSNA